MNKTIRWGIIAPGNIANNFAEAAAILDDTEIVSAGSRSIERALEFTGKWGIRRAFGSYMEVLEDTEVDAVYIASPHRYHAEQTIMALEAGKSVLCEKPVGVNASEFRAMTEIARARNLFLMEAMWSRFLPTFQTLKKDWLASGKLGQLRRIHADLSFAAPENPEGRLMNPELAGGALLDVGIYPITLAYWLKSCKPDRMKSQVRFGPTGVDNRGVVLMDWDDGTSAVLTMGLDVNGSMEASVMGTEGVVDMDRIFFGGSRMVFRNESGEEEFSHPHKANGYEYEIIEANRCIREGLMEAPDHSWKETLEVLEIMDRLRSDWGLRYPFE